MLLAQYPPIGAGYKTVRFWNNDVVEHLDGVLQVIYRHLPP
ncbi:MAG: DUF559 domain-containing protein, partial [bacterium]|nr:DUF559 domain-containing protein [bacterium]